ncbi:MAG TPA: hypothetical protein PLV52_00565 [Candidatus Omnitrophota bacterium]|nr:hypothetical protein [Candidatus Omnitrophota bacterium]
MSPITSKVQFLIIVVLVILCSINITYGNDLAYSQETEEDEEIILTLRGRENEVNGLVLRGPGPRTGLFSDPLPGRNIFGYYGTLKSPIDIGNNDGLPEIKTSYTTYQKDRLGREIRADTYSGNDILISSKATTYNKGGKIAKTVTKNAEGAITATASYGYDKEWNRTTETITTYNGLVKDIKYTNYIDPAKSYHREYSGSNLTQNDKYDLASGRMIYISMTYNSEGKLLTSFTRDAPGLAGKTISKTENEYSQDGLTKTKSTVTKYEYYDDGSVKTEDIKYTDSKNTANSYHKKYYYDTGKNLTQVDTIKGANTVISSTVYEKDKETTTTFNNLGEVTAIEIKTASSREKSYYTNAGTRLTRRDTLDSSGAVSSSVKYSYNTQGDLSSEALTTYTYSAGKLDSEKTLTTNKTTGAVSQTRTSYTYDTVTGTRETSTKTTYKGTSDTATGSVLTKYTEDGNRRESSETRDKNGKTVYTCTYYNDKNNRIATKTLVKPDKDGNTYFTYENESGSPLAQASPYKPEDLTKSAVASNDLLTGTARMQVEQMQAQTAIPAGIGTGGLVTNTGAGETQTQPTNNGNPI